MYIYKKENILYIDIILFAVIAAVLATNLYRVLGKRTIADKTVFKEKAIDNDINENIFSDEVKEYSQKQILELDNNFDFKSFIKGAKEAFKIIVESYNNKKLSNVKNLISEEVYDKFQNSIQVKSNSKSSFRIISVKAHIFNISVENKFAKIKVEFLSNQEKTVSEKPNRFDNVKDVWTFEKNMSIKSPIWKLVEVGIK